MIDPLVRAMQSDKAGPPLRFLRVTIASTSPLKVTLPGGGTVAGVAIPGLAYTTGQQAYALYLEPAIGPVFPT